MLPHLIAPSESQPSQSGLVSPFYPTPRTIPSDARSRVPPKRHVRVGQIGQHLIQIPRDMEPHPGGLPHRPRLDLTIEHAQPTVARPHRARARQILPPIRFSSMPCKIPLCKTNKSGRFRFSPIRASFAAWAPVSCTCPIGIAHHTAGGSNSTSRAFATVVCMSSSGTTGARRRNGRPLMARPHFPLPGQRYLSRMTRHGSVPAPPCL